MTNISNQRPPLILYLISYILYLNISSCLTLSSLIISYQSFLILSCHYPANTFQKDAKLREPGALLIYSDYTFLHELLVVN